MSVASYIELLDWTARHIIPDKRGSTPSEAPAILERLVVEPTAWCELVRDFGKLFSTVAGRPTVVDAARSLRKKRRFHATPRLRQLLGS